jgi:hypothetical protein
MAYTRSLSEIITKAQNLKTREEKIAWLKENNSMELRTLMNIVYDPKTYVWNIPNSSAPPYSPSVHNESHGMLYRQVKLLPYLIKGFSGENLAQAKREKIFIEMLEMIDKDDALLMLKVLLQKPFTNLPIDVINESLNQTFETPVVKRKTKNG